MAISKQLGDREWGKFKESTSTSGQVGVVLVNPDGSDISTPSSYATDDSAMPATPKIIPVGSEYRASPTTYTDGDAAVLQSDANGNLKVTLATALAGEDLTNDVLKTEQRFSYSTLVADGQIKASAGFVHSITITSDAAATAGSIILYDNTAESGTAVFTITIPAAYITPVTIILDVIMATGIYMGFTTTGDVTVCTSYR